MNIKKPKK